MSSSRTGSKILILIRNNLMFYAKDFSQSSLHVEHVKWESYKINVN